MCIRIRRGDQIAAAAHPRLVGLVADPDVVVELGLVLGLDVVGAVLEAHQVARGVLAYVEVEEVRPKPELRPAHHRRARGPAGRSCGSRGRRPAGRRSRPGRTMSPPADGRIERVAGQRRQVGQRGRSLAGQPEPVVEQRRPEADGDREVGRAQPERLAGVDRRRCRARCRPRRSAGPAVIRERRRRPRRRASCCNVLDVACVVTSKAANASRSCAGVAIPAWCAP